MKTLLLSLLLVLALSSSGFAQQIYAKDFPARTQQIGFTINLTTPGPLEIIANTGPAPTLASTAEISVQVDGALPYLVGSSTLVYTTNSLAEGTHEVVVSASYSDGFYPTGAAIVIAPNEPGSTASDQSAINTEITALQSQISTDESNIAALQSAVSNTSLQTAEAQDAADISALQIAVSGLNAQLTSIDNTLQGEITAQGNQIAVLQGAESTDASDIATIQGQIAALQLSLATDEANQAADESKIASLQSQQTAMEAQQQTDASQLAALQSQQAQDQAALGTLQSQIAQNQAAQQVENTTLENQIVALQGVHSSVDAGAQIQINSLNKSNHITRNLTYAGLGIGVAGIATAVDALLSEGDSTGDTTGTDSSTDGSPDSKAVTQRP